MAAISGDWLAPLSAEFRKPYYRKLYETVMREYAARTVYPPPEDLFSAFEFTPLSSVKAVILGQDPYHEEGQAHGLCFSVRPGVEVPPSLANIFRELHDDLDCRIPDNGCLIPWARQGVLLLNTVLTVRAHRAASHRGIGWEEFTDAVIRYLSANCSGIVFLLWGNFAKAKAALIDSSRHHVLQAAHPSPLAGGAFFGCRHFSQTNNLLMQEGKTPINWQL